MKKSILTFGTALLCAGVVFAVIGEKKQTAVHNVASKTTLTCPTVYDSSPSLQCNDGFTVYGVYQGPYNYSYDNCACEAHGGPNPLLPL